MFKRAKIQIRKYWKTNLITFIIALLIGATIFTLMYNFQGKNIISAVNGSAVAFVVVLFLGLLALVHHLGAFDSFVFGFKQLGSMIFARNARRDGTYVDYRDEKKTKRDNSSFNFFAFIAASLIFGILLIVLEIIYHTNY